MAEVEDMWQDMGFPSKEAYQDYLDGKDIQMMTPEDEAEISAMSKRIFILLSHDARDVVLLGCFGEKRLAEYMRDEYVKKNPGEERSVKMLEGELFQRFKNL